MADQLGFEQRLQRLEDIHDIKTLMHRYAYAANIVDGPGDLDAFAALFAENAEWDVGMGRYVGPAAIRARMAEITTQWFAALHLMLNPVIEVAGDRATGKFLGLFPFLAESTSRPIWMSNIYENEFVRTTAGWRFSKVSTTTLFQPVEFNDVYAEALAAQ